MTGNAPPPATPVSIDARRDGYAVGQRRARDVQRWYGNGTSPAAGDVRGARAVRSRRLSVQPGRQAAVRRPAQQLQPAYPARQQQH